MVKIAIAGINSFALSSLNPDLFEKTLCELLLLNNKVTIFITKNNFPRAFQVLWHVAQASLKHYDYLKFATVR